MSEKKAEVVAGPDSLDLKQEVVQLRKDVKDLYKMIATLSSEFKSGITSLRNCVHSTNLHSCSNCDKSKWF